MSGAPYYADESQYAIIHVGTLGGDAWMIVERVPGGWQSGTHHYPDDVVLDVQPLNLRDYLRAEGLAEWQRKVADALGVSEGPGPGYPWHCADADEAARYASAAVQDSLDLAESERLRAGIAHIVARYGTAPGIETCATMYDLRRLVEVTPDFREEWRA